MISMAGVSAQAQEACSAVCAKSNQSAALLCAVPSSTKLVMQKSDGVVEMAGATGMEPASSASTQLAPGARISLLQGGSAKVSGLGCSADVSGPASVDVSASGSCTCVSQDLGLQAGIGPNTGPNPVTTIVGGTIAAGVVGVGIGIGESGSNGPAIPVTP